jgi:hypothetical protein
VSRTAVRAARTGSAVLAVLLLSAIPAAWPAPALAAARPGSPSPGDWEATRAPGLVHVSFAVASAGRSSRGAGGAQATVKDLTIAAPIGCSDAPAPAPPVDVRVIAGPLALSPSGGFSSGAVKHGSGTVVVGRFRAGRFSLSYRHVSRTKNPYDGGAEVCDTGTVHIAAVRGHRRLLKVGVWRGQTGTHEPVVFYVTAGGRALQAPARPPANGSAPVAFAFGQFTQTCFTGGCTPSSSDICAYQSASTIFVASTGGFGNAELQRGDDANVAGRFTGTNRASGVFANGPEGCLPTSWSARPG